MDALPEAEADKENNDDSAICTLNTTGFTASDCTKSLSPPSSASGATSKTSSPDSGASSGSPRSTTEDGTTKDEVGEIDRLLGTTRISPLAKTSNS